MPEGDTRSAAPSAWLIDAFDESISWTAFSKPGELEASASASAIEPSRVWSAEAFPLQSVQFSGPPTSKGVWATHDAANSSISIPAIAAIASFFCSDSRLII
jgi:hypothetical protein